ncbi:SCO family protein [Dyadobacter pollutisoli]|jgi:protein SCO1/2|uniref:SCO family protein n=1 Tax=Dyadobacter pollutisoli TaxID=2910158 RepID=A0A9E8NCC9_9BACT|nr:SCO family protein [Dyadobacter pollutisoli]WAC12381.1 SCO family protein [Dyadobacter pollutisoli]
MKINCKTFSFNTIILSIVLISLFGCGGGDNKLPILGERDWEKKTVDGKEVVDTIYNTIPPFSFVNQEGDTVSEKIVEGKIYVTDFFFTTCPTICPVMKRQMVKVFQQFKGNPDVMILSHTIDPEHDTPQVLNKFAKDLGVEGTQWQFLTGDKDKIYKIGQESYMSTAKEDKSAEGGYIHSGAFILVDKEKHVRGMYDGTTEEGTQKLIADMKRLLDEYKK